jgi:hypothetical protein
MKNAACLEGDSVTRFAQALYAHIALILDSSRENSPPGATLHKPRRIARIFLPLHFPRHIRRVYSLTLFFFLRCIHTCHVANIMTCNAAKFVEPVTFAALKLLTQAPIVRSAIKGHDKETMEACSMAGATGRIYTLASFRKPPRFPLPKRSRSYLSVHGPFCLAAD